MNRVTVSRCMVGLCAMQVCTVKDATDDEILEVCNRENPSGTSNGWSGVIREVKDGDSFYAEDSLPVPCEEHPDRLHFLVLC